MTLLNLKSCGLQFNQCGVEMIRRDLLTGHWKPYIDRAMSLKPCYAGGVNGGEVYSLLYTCTCVCDSVTVYTEIGDCYTFLIDF